MLSMETWRNEFDERFPIYQQIVNLFCRSLVKGEIEPGERIPSIRDLAHLLKVNTNTIQRSYQEMARKNLIYSQRGMGYFVMQEKEIITRVKHEMVTESTTRFIKELRALGFSDKQIRMEIEKQLEGGVEEHAYDDQRA